MKNMEITVVLTTYNRPSNFKTALDSLVSQNFKKFELIVIDDNSQENYALDCLIKSGLTYKYHKNTANLGIAKVRNLGIVMASTPIISFLDDDDEYYPNFLYETFHALSNTEPKVSMSWSNAKINVYNDKSNTATFSVERRFDCQPFGKYSDLLSIGTGYGLAIKASCFDDIGGFDSDHKLTEDSEFFVRFMSAGYQALVLPGLNILINHHMAVRQTSAHNDHLRVQESEIILQKYSSFFQKNNTLKQEMENYIDALKIRISEGGRINKTSSVFIASGTLV